VNSVKIVVACAAAVALSTIAACSESSPKSAVKAVVMPTPTTAGTTPSSVDQAKQAALTAYTNMWGDAVIAARTADWKYPALAHHATDHALDELVKILSREQAQGLVSRGAPELHPRVVQVAPIAVPTAVMIEDCTNAAAWPEIDPKTGNPPVGATPDGLRLVRARVAETDLVWRVTDLAIEKIGSCS
jgi:hypothetical protein